MDDNDVPVGKLIPAIFKRMFGADAIFVLPQEQFKVVSTLYIQCKFGSHLGRLMVVQVGADDDRRRE